MSLQWRELQENQWVQAESGYIRDACPEADLVLGGHVIQTFWNAVSYNTITEGQMGFTIKNKGSKILHHQK